MLARISPYWRRRVCWFTNVFGESKVLLSVDAKREESGAAVIILICDVRGHGLNIRRCSVWNDQPRPLTQVNKGGGGIHASHQKDSVMLLFYPL
ncbi:hypothetical protein ACTXT7_012853 [Hymenolepis weldensis]